MLSLEEYIHKRKTEDGINEKDKEKRMENMQFCMNYLFEYFNQYMDTATEDPKMIQRSRKIEKYYDQLRNYTPEIRDWLVELYSEFGKYVNVTIRNMIEDTFFLLYDSDAEYRALSYAIYAKAIKKLPFLAGQSENLFNLLKDIHTDSSIMTPFQEDRILPGDINEWVNKVYRQHGVNLYTFCFSYLEWFWQSPEVWPRDRKSKDEEHSLYTPKDPLYWHYDCKTEGNRFNLNELYRRMPRKPFLKASKKKLEAIMMYTWLFEIGADKSEYWEEYCDQYEKEQD